MGYLLLGRVAAGLPWLVVGFIEDPSRGACLNPTCSCWSSWRSCPSPEFSMGKFDRIPNAKVDSASCAGLKGGGGRLARSPR
jgi:hypothetical protein